MIVLVALAAAIPLAMVGTIMLMGLWRWIEAFTGIESVGHSGPAGWCYVVTYIVIAVLGITIGACVGADRGRGTP